MYEPKRQIYAPLARWAARIALFSASLLLVTFVVHRITTFPTPVAMNVFALAYAGAAAALLAGVAAAVQVWRKGHGGAGSCALGIALPLLMAAWPLAYLPAWISGPRLNDVSTDLSEPPRFSALAAVRTGSANPAVFPASLADVQQKIYPDLRSLVIDRSVDEMFELAEETAARLKWKIVGSEAPVGRTGKGGYIEATDQTLIMGFTDDVVIRLEGNLRRTRVDVRSSSRYGAMDFGENAMRVRTFMAELKSRAENTLPSQIAGRRGLRSTRRGAMVKRSKEAAQEKGASRSERDRAQSGARRARGQKE